MSNRQRPAGIVELKVIDDLDDAHFDCPGCKAVTAEVSPFPPMVHVQTWHEPGCSWLRGRVAGR